MRASSLWALKHCLPSGSLIIPRKSLHSLVLSKQARVFELRCLHQSKQVAYHTTFISLIEKGLKWAWRSPLERGTDFSDSFIQFERKSAFKNEWECRQEKKEKRRRWSPTKWFLSSHERRLNGKISISFEEGCSSARWCVFVQPTN